MPTPTKPKSQTARAAAKVRDAEQRVAELEQERDQLQNARARLEVEKTDLTQQRPPLVVQAGRTPTDENRIALQAIDLRLAELPAETEAKIAALAAVSADLDTARRDLDSARGEIISQELLDLKRRILKAADEIDNNLFDADNWATLGTLVKEWESLILSTGGGFGSPMDKRGAVVHFPPNVAPEAKYRPNQLIEALGLRFRFELAKLAAVVSPFAIRKMPYAPPPPQMLAGGMATMRHALGLADRANGKH